MRDGPRAHPQTVRAARPADLHPPGEAGGVSNHVSLPQGFLFSACAAGIKTSGRADLALALIPEGAAAAALFTRNQVVAAPVIIGRNHLRASHAHVPPLIVNAANANCATGNPGLEAAKSGCTRMTRELRT